MRIIIVIKKKKKKKEKKKEKDMTSKPLPIPGQATAPPPLKPLPELSFVLKRGVLIKNKTKKNTPSTQHRKRKQQ